MVYFVIFYFAFFDILVICPSYNVKKSNSNISIPISVIKAKILYNFIFVFFQNKTKFKHSMGEIWVFSVSIGRQMAMVSLVFLFLCQSFQFQVSRTKHHYMITNSHFHTLSTSSSLFRKPCFHTFISFLCPPSSPSLLLRLLHPLNLHPRKT